jgi:hypothetical protein
MPTARAIRRTAAALGILAGLSLSTTQADTYYFKDTLRPNGHDRGMAAKYADGQACGASAGHTFHNVPACQTF